MRSGLWLIERTHAFVIVKLLSLKEQLNRSLANAIPAHFFDTSIEERSLMAILKHSRASLIAWPRASGFPPARVIASSCCAASTWREGGGGGGDEGGGAKGG